MFGVIFVPPAREWHRTFDEFEFFELAEERKEGEEVWHSKELFENAKEGWSSGFLYEKNREGIENVCESCGWISRKIARLIVDRRLAFSKEYVYFFQKFICKNHFQVF